MTVGCELAAGSQDSNQAQQERVDPAGAATEAMTLQMMTAAMREGV